MNLLCKMVANKNIGFSTSGLGKPSWVCFVTSFMSRDNKTTHRNLSQSLQPSTGYVVQYRPNVLGTCGVSAEHTLPKMPLQIATNTILPLKCAIVRECTTSSAKNHECCSAGWRWPGRSSFEHANLCFPKPKIPWKVLVTCFSRRQAIPPIDTSL